MGIATILVVGDSASAPSEYDYLFNKVENNEELTLGEYKELIQIYNKEASKFEISVDGDLGKSINDEIRNNN